MKRILLTLIVGILMAASAHAQSATSPDGKWVVFVKTVSGPLVDYGGDVARGADPHQPTELWQVDSHGKHPTLLAKCHDNEDSYKKITGFNDLHFSSDGRLVYFTSPTWARSGAVHVVDTTNRKEHFVCEGSLQDIQYSKDGDLLVVLKALYTTKPHFLNVIPDYYQSFLVTPDGKEVKTLGEPQVP